MSEVVKRLIVMRHGEAEPIASMDKQRALTVRGEAQVLATSKQLAKWGVEQIVASPYIRARQSAAIASRVLDVEVSIDPSLTPDSDPMRALSSLDDNYTGSLLVVSHMPLVSYLCASLLESGKQPILRFGTADAVVIESEFLLPGLGVMVTTIGPGGLC